MDRAAEGRAPYGAELILDLHDCDIEVFTKKPIEEYFKEICELIDMEREDLHFWDSADDDLTEEEIAEVPDHLYGCSAIQFITTSSIVIHTITKMKKVFVNIFSCKDFDSDIAREFTEKVFKGHTINNSGKGFFIRRY